MSGSPPWLDFHECWTFAFPDLFGRFLELVYRFSGMPGDKKNKALCANYRMSPIADGSFHGAGNPVLFSYQNATAHGIGMAISQFLCKCSQIIMGSFGFFICSFHIVFLLIQINVRLVFLFACYGLIIWHTGMPVKWFLKNF